MCCGKQRLGSLAWLAGSDYAETGEPGGSFMQGGKIVINKPLKEVDSVLFPSVSAKNLKVSPFQRVVKMITETEKKIGISVRSQGISF